MKLQAILSMMFVAFALVGSAAAQTDTKAADEAAIRKADEDWAKAAQTKSVPAWVAFYGKDAVVLPPNEKMVTTSEAIEKSIGGLLALPNLAISWKPNKVEAARSGEIGYSYGTYELSFKDSKGNTVSDRGKYVEVWKKQADGTWKCVLDAWSSDLPS
jgi:ketosteroid isomerase-like protein